MILRDLIRQPVPADAATATLATPATPATLRPVPARPVATVANVAVADPPGANISDLSPNWLAGLASLRHGPAPVGMGEARWRELVGDALKLAADWGARADALGWNAEALFGHDPNPSARRLDTAGLAALLDGRRVVAVDAASATILHLSGDLTRFRRFPFPGSINPGAGSVPLWCLARGTEPLPGETA